MRNQITIACLLLLASGAGAAHTYTVGSTFGCDYPDLRPALIAVANETGSHIIKTSRDTDRSLSYSRGNPDAEVQIIDPLAHSIVIEGGYQDCTAQFPQAGATSTITVSGIDDNVNHTLLTITDRTASPFRLELHQVIVEGRADLSSEPGPLWAGGLQLQGNVKLVLGESSAIRNFRAEYGGGVYLHDLSGDEPELVLLAGSSIDHNEAKYDGGGIYAEHAKVTLQGGSVDDNTAAEGNGGGIWIQSDGDPGDIHSNPQFVDLHVIGSLDYSEVTSSVSSNQAMQGRGGGIYSDKAWILVETGQSVGIYGSYKQPGLEVYDNLAELGGGLYIEGPQEDVGGPFTDLIMYDTAFRFNIAYDQGGAMYIKDAVDGEVTGSSGRCEFDQHAAPCSQFRYNWATNQNVTSGNPPGGGAVYMTDDRGDGISRPRMRFNRSLFFHNMDTNGSTAVAAAMSFAHISFNRSIFLDNLGNGNSVLVYNANDHDLDFRYNTVLDNDTTRIFGYYGDGTVYLRGSILWMPGHGIWYHIASASMQHDGCLISHTGYDIPPGALLMAPKLGEDFAPKGSSPALDFCNSYAYSPMLDAYLQDVVDVAGIANHFTGWAPEARDLGAVEQTDIIHANNFGDRDTY